LYSGSVVARFAAPRRGVFAAVDLTTNKIVWRQQWVDQCYSGSIVTKSGLLFIGRNDGRLTALDKSNGHKLWEFQTDGGVNAPASTFEYNGKQYVVVLAGGTALAGSKRSDGLWLFSLDGTMNSLPRGSADPAGQFPRPGGPAGGAPGGGPPGGAPAAPGAAGVAAGGRGASAAAPTPGRVANVDQGKEIYTTTCVVCHGETGKGGSHGGAPLTHTLTQESVVNVVTRGRNDMPPFGSALPPDQLQDLTAYLLQLAAKN
jgi:quinohemoprotein ethanol dehydrogenase